MNDFAALGGLFGTAFLAATLLPAQSEAALAGLILAGTHPAALLVTVASVGNIAGSIVSWLIGRGLWRAGKQRWFPASAKSLDRASKWYHRYGRWSLLLSWAPFIGDPLTVVAGALKEPLWSFLAIVTVAKAGRYIALAAAVTAW